MLQNLKPNRSKEKKWKKWNRTLVKEGLRKNGEERILGFDRFVKYNPDDWDDAYTPDNHDDFTGVYVMAPGYGNIFPFDDINMCTCSIHTRDMELNDEFRWHTFGLSDNASQVIDYYNDLKGKGLKGNHVIIMQFMNSFRWHKWGQYIGYFEPHCEYFNDEQGIDYVFSFEILQVR